MRAGKLRHRLKLQSPGTGKNDYNEPVESWPDVATVWGSVEPLNGREYFQAMQYNPEITHQIKIRYRTGLKPNMRFNIGSQVFEILYYFRPENRKREIHCWVKERIDDG